MIVHYTNWRFEKPNEIGDSSGLANGLFSALAFAGVIYAILLQRRELRLQRAELEQTREELKGQKQEFQTQNDTLRHQRFENTFFQMLSLHHEITSQLHASFDMKETQKIETFNGPTFKEIEKKIEVNGRGVFKVMYENYITEVEEKSYPGMRVVINNFGIEGYVKANTVTVFDHYFRNLYRIIKFVDESKLIPERSEKYSYTSILRGQLSNYELVWIFYNCLSYFGEEKFKPLIERYALFKNLREELLVDPNWTEKYSYGAFNFIP